MMHTQSQATQSLLLSLQREGKTRLGAIMKQNWAASLPMKAEYKGSYLCWTA